MILYESDILKLEQIKAYIISNLEKDLGVTNLCKLFSISKSKLKRQFSFYFKSSIHHYIQHQRLLLAHSLLCNRQYSVTTISMLCGYKDRCSFTHAFTSFFKYTPLECLKSQKMNLDFLPDNIVLNQNDTHLNHLDT